MTQDPLAFEFFNEIGILEQLSGALLDGVLPKGMTRAQFSVLNHFVRLDVAEKSPAALASAFQVTRPTMTSTLGRMEKNGLISIRADPQDGRAKLVSLTPAGRAMRETCLSALAPMVPVLNGMVSQEEMNDLLPRLRAIRIRLDAARN
ncbi:MAG: MarR family transcriptional regulator [Sphingomonadales bacterium]|jgi:DNA-binding MarR family transcriptional regulator|nr:MarR family transcriptional regulator [Sphingomonadales bacterium]